jgi:hypothetical protein
MRAAREEGQAKRPDERPFARQGGKCTQTAVQHPVCISFEDVANSTGWHYTTCLVLGGSGSGKGSGFVRPAVM